MYLDFFGKLCINITIFFEVILEIIKLGLKGISVYFEFVYIFKEPVFTVFGMNITVNL